LYYRICEKKKKKEKEMTDGQKSASQEFVLF
jgi:hypothetical protein